MAKTATKSEAKKSGASSNGSTIRERVFRYLAKKPQSTGAQIKTALALSGIPSLLKDEAVGDKPRIKREQLETVRGIAYSLTAQGKKDLEAGKVDENAAGPSKGAGLLRELNGHA